MHKEKMVFLDEPQLTPAKMLNQNTQPCQAALKLMLCQRDKFLNGQRDYFRFL
jgi:hypothetical protein